MKAPISLRSRRNVCETFRQRCQRNFAYFSSDRTTRKRHVSSFKAERKLEFNARKTSLCTFLSLNSSQRVHRTRTSLPPLPPAIVNVCSAAVSKRNKAKSRRDREIDLPQTSILRTCLPFQLYARSNQSSRCARGMHGAEYRMTDN